MISLFKLVFIYFTHPDESKSKSTGKTDALELYAPRFAFCGNKDMHLTISIILYIPYKYYNSTTILLPICEHKIIRKFLFIMKTPSAAYAINTKRLCWVQ